jgi:hypothetical protein
MLKGTNIIMSSAIEKGNIPVKRLKGCPINVYVIFEYILSTVSAFNDE